VAELKASASWSADDIQIHTKYVPDLDKLETVQFEDTEHIIDRSLRRLNRERLDLVQFHWWDYDIPRCVEVAGHLVRLKEKGKIRNIGVTNFDTGHLAALVAAGVPVASIQTQYSMFDRRPERAQLDYCRAHGIAMFCYGTLSGGFLSEKYLGRADFTPETRSQVKYMQVIEDSLGLEGMQRLLALLKQIGEDMKMLLQLYKPDEIAFEELFFAKNVTTALTVGAARGVAIAACAEYTDQLYEYTPMQVKQAIVGYGKAEKQQIQQMVKLLLRMEEIAKPDDAADAIAIALTHAAAGPARTQFAMK
jgi:crossover junction endodeoxyribonuclease RuvC